MQKRKAVTLWYGCDQCWACTGVRKPLRIISFPSVMFSSSYCSRTSKEAEWDAFVSRVENVNTKGVCESSYVHTSPHCVRGHTPKTCDKSHLAKTFVASWTECTSVIAHARLKSTQYAGSIANTYDTLLLGTDDIYPGSWNDMMFIITCNKTVIAMDRCGRY